jgi:HEAT repeat protein
MIQKNYQSAVANYKRVVELEPSMAAKDLVSLLTYNDSVVRDEAAKAVSSLSNGLNEVVNEILLRLDDSNQYVKVDYLEAIKRIGKPASFAVSGIAKYLNHESSIIKKAALETFAVMNPQDVKNCGAFDSIMKLSKDKDAVVSETAVKTIGAYKTDSSKALSMLIIMYNDKNPVIQAAAKKAVSDIGRANKEAIPGLISLLDAKYSSNIRIAAIDSLAAMGPAANASVVNLVLLTVDKDNDVKVAAVSALGKVGKPSEDSVPDLIKLLKHDDVSIQMRAIIELAELGKAASPALPALSKLKKHSNKAISSEAKKAEETILNSKR